LLGQPPPNAASGPALAMTFEAAKDLLPDWAAAMHGFRLSRAGRATTRIGVAGLGRTLRWALVNSAEARARRRAAELIQPAAGQG
jgi:hypothetical protein